MGMDVYGKAPIDEVGRYLQHSVWSWRPLAQLVCELAPDETSGCKYWQKNVGDGLDAAGAIRLADALDSALHQCRVTDWIAARDRYVAGLSREQCFICGGSGIRTDKIGQDLNYPQRIIGPEWGHKPDHPRYGQTGWCNGCDGRGDRAPRAGFYRVTVEDVVKFVSFLRACGGFEIR